MKPKRATLQAVHHSLRHKRRRPHGMDCVGLSHEQTEGLANIVLPIFADCSNVGLGFQDALVAVYLSGLNHGMEAQKERTADDR